MKLSYDLHIHSCLSPCGDMDMTPNNIVNMISLIGLDVFAVTDHNSAKNIKVISEIAKDMNITFIPGIELNTSEEVHLLSLFSKVSDCLDFDEYIYKFLPDFKNDAENFGEQAIMDKSDTTTGHEDKLLINALTLGIEDILKVIDNFNGIIIPAHVDKNSYSIISSLGFIPEEYNFSCIEVKNKDAKIDFPYRKITNSDAHYLENINEPVNFIDISEKSAECFIDTLKRKH